MNKERGTFLLVVNCPDDQGSAAGTRQGPGALPEPALCLQELEHLSHHLLPPDTPAGSLALESE